MDFDRRCTNHTPLSVRCVPSLDRRGQDVLVIVAKLTCVTLGDGTLLVAARQRPVRLHDVLTSPSEAWSSIQLPGDAADEKPGTDVLLMGTVPPPRRANFVDVALRAGPIHKTVRVHGPRSWYEGALGVVPGPAQPLVPTALVWENTFGGVDLSDPQQPLYDWRNPAGNGAARDRKRLIGRPAPVLEDPDAPGTPAAFAPIAPSWEPRRAFAGTYDDDWRRTRAPVRPLDFDPRHHCCAPPGLWSATPLVGGDTIDVTGATEDGAWRARLPREEPSFHVLLDEGIRRLDTHLDTVLIDIDAREIELSWRAALVLPRKLAAFHGSVVDLAEPAGAPGPVRLPTVS